MKRRGYWYVALATTFNIILNAATRGRRLWLEGRVDSAGVFRNWCRRFRHRPQRHDRPATEEEIVALVKRSRRLRLFGAGHSFNDGVVAEETLVSLDRYAGVVWKDPAKKQVRVRGGTRVRDIARLLLEDGLAFGALPSHDAQSIAGIISTDVHGTGRDWGFVSQWVEELRLIDGRGEAHECRPGDDLFKAAIGGVGGVGIITEVTLQAVERFNVEQKVEQSTFGHVEQNFEQLFQANKHFSLYLFPFTDRCQINTWNPTKEMQTPNGALREFLAISKDALLTAWFGGFMSATGLLPRLSSLAYAFKRGTDLVLESNAAFNRTIYPLHQELEFTVEFERTFDVCRRFIKLYEEMYRAGRLPYTLLEIRFTPAGHDRTLLGAGRERRSTWVNLVCNDTDGFERYYEAAESLMREVGARPHLGKYCQSFGPDGLRREHGPHFDKFLELVRAHDPEGKFANGFTRRTFFGE